MYKVFSLFLPGCMKSPPHVALVYLTHETPSGTFLTRTFVSPHRYMESGTNSTTAAFAIPMNKCGTTVTEPDETELVNKSQMKTGFSNIIIVQMDPLVQVRLAKTTQIEREKIIPLPLSAL